ncbi:MAG: hypothetical protein KAV87_64850, partial [Desulfobacteraceae bacterium]|nr:hypothetical protein [Desulfobacteraceae bacterium]
ETVEATAECTDAVCCPMGGCMTTPLEDFFDIQTMREYYDAEKYGKSKKFWVQTNKVRERAYLCT